jgi:isoprenylcysteine carboxyl methyltransferase (ICMT) family protein YpbQ
MIKNSKKQQRNIEREHMFSNVFFPSFELMNVASVLFSTFSLLFFFKELDRQWSTGLIVRSVVTYWSSIIIK